MNIITPDLERRRKFFTPNGWMTRERTKSEITHWKTMGFPHPDTEDNDRRILELNSVI